MESGGGVFDQHLFTETPTLVAQTCSLLYRRFVTCGSSAESRVLGVTDARPITNRRYGRLKICATGNRYFDHSRDADRRFGSRPLGAAAFNLVFGILLALVIRASSLSFRPRNDRLPQHGPLGNYRA